MRRAAFSAEVKCYDHFIRSFICFYYYFVNNQCQFFPQSLWFLLDVVTLVIAAMFEETTVAVWQDEGVRKVGREKKRPTLL